MKKIPLTQGQFAIVDDKNFYHFNQWNWQAKWNKDTKSFYAVRNETYYVDGVRHRRFLTMSREIMKTPKGMLCDHKNHKTLDNQEHNLRNVTNSQNMMNRKGAQKNNRLGVLGVRQNGYGFQAHISVNRKIKCFPNRKTIEEATQDRKDAEKIYHGKFSRNQDEVS